MVGNRSTDIDNLIEIIDTRGDYKPSPIVSSWVLEGNPTARMKVLSTSHDGTATSVMWDCTAGRFNWFYSFDETVYVLEGGMKLKENGVTRVVGVGESVFFPAGSMAEWTVDAYVKKVAFLRTPLPRPLIMARRVWQRVKRLGRGGASSPAPMTGFG